MKEGDIVTRKSYNQDIIFKITGFSKGENNKKIALLKGVAFRLIADAYLDDLVLVEKNDIREFLIDKNVQNLLYRSVIDARKDKICIEELLNCNLVLMFMEYRERFYK